jgi:hypothetical protein
VGFFMVGALVLLFEGTFSAAAFAILAASFAHAILITSERAANHGGSPIA